MSYLVKYGREPQISVADANDLDAILDRLAPRRGRGGAPYMVRIFTLDKDGEYVGIQIGVGHPRRSFVFYAGEPGGGYGQQTGIPPLTGEITFDCGGQATEYPPGWARVTPETARQAAREFVTNWPATCLRALGLPAGSLTRRPRFACWPLPTVEIDRCRLSVCDGVRQIYLAETCLRRLANRSPYATASSVA